MKCRPFELIFRILLILYIAAVAVLCFADFHSIPDVGKTIFGLPSDKVVHFIMFFPLPILCFTAFGRGCSTIGKTLMRLLYIVCFSCVFAGLTEIIQGTLPYRSQDINDFYSDCMAIASGALLTLIFKVISILRSK